MRVLEGERNGHKIDEEGKPVFALDSFVLRLKPAHVTQAAADGQSQKKKTEAGDNHGRDVESDGERVHLLVEHVRGEKRQQRQAEEKAEVGIEDEFVGLLGAVNELVMVNPVNAGEGEGEEVKAQGGWNRGETPGAVLVGHLQIQSHDGDDDGDDSVGEGFEAGWIEDVMSHGDFRSGRSIQRDLRRSAVGALKLMDEPASEFGDASGREEGGSCGLFA